MSKLNPTTKHNSSMLDDQRLAGGGGNLAARQSNEQLLRRCVMACLLWEDVAYADGVSVADEIARLVPLCSAQQVFDIAIEARQVHKLRHTPIFIAVQMCRHEEHRKLVDKLLPQILTRPDMLTDFLALYWQSNPDGKKSLCHRAMKGLAAALCNFDEYQLAKYDRETAVKLRDVMFLTHPTPRDEAQAALFRKVAERTLAVPDTWEVDLSAGNDKKETWTRLINEHRLGGLALLRNIANMRRAQVDKSVIDAGLERISSRWLLPLDFLKARKMNPEFEREIEEAMLRSMAQRELLKGRTLLIVDVSGSMSATMSSRSEFTRLECAEALAMLAANQCEEFLLVCTSGSDSKRQCENMLIRYPKKGFGIIDQIHQAYHELGGGGIFTRQCLERCKDFLGDDFDRIIVISDSQDCDYPDKRVPQPFGRHNYVCDVSCETRGIAYQGVWTAEISGFSEHFLAFIAALEAS